ncbi:hypothetical protein [Streptomyces sp. NRRL F-2664]|uniref:hypothetical protein n=1 Tax=Streptomyces sp. NRRL F-2664 TaxID=1463842 RepID=UPI00131DA58B|nr:hypothetical protein [Streptomyces sp. NRRL F-2664]
MTVVVLSASPDQPALLLDGNLVTDVIWSTATTGDRLEHVYTRSTAGRLDIVLFPLAADAREAAATADRIIHRALTGAPFLAGWTPARDPPAERAPPWNPV